SEGDVQCGARSVWRADGAEPSVFSGTGDCVRLAGGGSAQRSHALPGAIDGRGGPVGIGRSREGSDVDCVRRNEKRMWIAGKEVSLESRHTRLYERYKNRPK